MYYTINYFITWQLCFHRSYGKWRILIGQSTSLERPGYESRKDFSENAFKCLKLSQKHLFKPCYKLLIKLTCSVRTGKLLHLFFCPNLTRQRACGNFPAQTSRSSNKQLQGYTAIKHLNKTLFSLENENGFRFCYMHHLFRKWFIFLKNSSLESA